MTRITVLILSIQITWALAKEHLLSDICQILADYPIRQALDNMGIFELLDIWNLTNDKLNHLDY